ncbi:MAG: hypothetical protein Q8S33_27455 [Myxococcales bacterium]|nr:hypothetical protein [Myxococcales bacterium]MDP3504106.1 hypothetical protein [Myxococcales bacterium]
MAGLCLPNMVTLLLFLLATPPSDPTVNGKADRPGPRLEVTGIEGADLQLVRARQAVLRRCEASLPASAAAATWRLVVAVGPTGAPGVEALNVDEPLREAAACVTRWAQQLRFTAPDAGSRHVTMGLRVVPMAVEPVTSVEREQVLALRRAVSAEAVCLREAATRLEAAAQASAAKDPAGWRARVEAAQRELAACRAIALGLVGASNHGSTPPGLREPCSGCR